MRSMKITAGRHPDGYAAYPVGSQGVVVGVRRNFCYGRYTTEGPRMKLPRSEWETVASIEETPD
ncbi:MAG: hypothetical protein C5617_001540 [ANME-2 cluster archaeon]|nr:MAG: hypothetical protein C5617_001540 [ANME-2 cluster archaeon]